MQERMAVSDMASRPIPNKIYYMSCLLPLTSHNWHHKHCSDPAILADDNQYLVEFATHHRKVAAVAKTRLEAAQNQAVEAEDTKPHVPKP